ncbi:MAG: DUF3516 domain-containing protein, partial [Myxococcota bacterium]
PRYRLLVEKLAQQGLLRVICGTDTLGVGVNVPIRTVVFTSLTKYDGEKVGVLRVRECKQIAGRAGRKGFDEQGYVVCQAPEHLIENRRQAAKSGPGKKPPRKAQPPRGFVPWNRDTFEKLIEKPPEMLRSRFRVGHGMLVNVLQREEEAGSGANGYGALIALINRSHESDKSKARLRRRAALLFRALHQAGIVRTVFDTEVGSRRARVSPGLQVDFNLHRSLSLYLVEAVQSLDPEAPGYALEVLSLAEAIQEDPVVLLRAQQSRAKAALMAQLKAERVPYEERLEKLDAVTWPRPEAEFIEGSFRVFREAHPWVGEADVRPKGIAREMAEGYRDFGDFVKEYAVARSEGLLLRYLSQVHNTLVQNVPEDAKTEEVYDVIAFLRTTLQRVDSSLVEAWETLVDPAAPTAVEPSLPEAPRFDLASRPKALAARVRAELHGVVHDLAAEDYDAAAERLLAGPDEPWTGARLAEALVPFLEEYGRIDFTPRARQAHQTRLDPVEPRRWLVSHVLCDPQQDDLWALIGEVDLRQERDPEGPLVRLTRIGT